MKLIRTSLFPAVLLALATQAAAQAPELSADAPIEYREAEGLLIAAGNAVYTDENTRVEANTIRYNRDFNRIEAEGAVRVTRAGIRLLADHLIYEAETKTISAGRFRAGYPPLFIEGESFAGTLDQIDFSKVTLYFKEPVASSPSLRIASGTWISEQSVHGTGLRLNTLGNLAIPLPAFEYAFGAPSLDVSSTVGYRDRLGVYAQSSILYPFNRRLSAGGNLDLYSQRGILVGPAFVWKQDTANLDLTVDTGWIHDHSFSDRGNDILGQPIGQDRGFAGFGLRADNGGSLQFQARALYLSDSEVLRDFRHEAYFREYQPDNFADFTWQHDQFLLNVFARRQISDYYGVIERLPEIRAEWLPSELARTGLYVQAAAAALRYRLKAVTPFDFNVQFPDNPLGLPGPLTFSGRPPWEMFESPYYNRLDGSLTLTRPIALPAGVDLVLRGGGRWSDYSQDGGDAPPELAGDRLVGELGFDLSRTVARTYRVDRPEWNMERLRHTTRLGLQYRWHPGAEEEEGFIPPIERFPYHARRPALDLADLAHTDGLQEWSVARIGWENRLMVAGEGESYRDLLAFNLYQDILFSADPGEDEWNALYVEADFTPFSWMSLYWRQKLLTEQQYSEASYVGINLTSADLWGLNLEAEYLRKAIEQYRLAGWYRLSETIGLTAMWQYDARLSAWTRQQYGVTRRFANVWQVELYVALNDENSREDDFSVGLRLTWLSF